MSAPIVHGKAVHGKVDHEEVDLVRVDLADRGYDILVGPGRISAAGTAVAERLGQRRTIVVADRALAPAWTPILTASLSEAGHRVDLIELPGGEATKSFDNFQKLVEAVLGLGVDRGSVIVAAGGGVIGDLAGYIAAAVLRGLDYVQVPTTLLSQVDSSVGGKTAINSAHGKNLIGAFHQPRLVLIDTAVLDTLPERELRAGYAEVAKYGLIRDPGFFAWLEANGEAVIRGDEAARRHAVVESCRAKAAVVGADELEAADRALLNFGHTFGHAIEAEAGYDGSVLHGEAVSVGMVLAMRLSHRLGLATAADVDRTTAHLAAHGLPVSIEQIPGGRNRFAPQILLRHMAKDKKVRDGRVRFVLARGIGDAFVSDAVEPDIVLDLLGERIAA